MILSSIPVLNQRYFGAQPTRTSVNLRASGTQGAFIMTNNVQRYAGQVAVVTGAGSGIGREIALKLSREGARVALWDLSKDSLPAAETQARVSGSEAISKLIDVSSEADVAAGMDEALEIAAGIPLAKLGSIEVRPIMKITV